MIAADFVDRLSSSVAAHIVRIAKLQNRSGWRHAAQEPIAHARAAKLTLVSQAV
jgi:hypothetical protein